MLRFLHLVIETAKLKQRSWLEDRGKLRNPVWSDEQGDQPEHEAIERGQIRGAAARAIADDDLLLEQQ